MAGLAPVARESGKCEGRRFIGGGCSVRKLLYLTAVSAVHNNPDPARSYSLLRERGNPGKTALAAVMRILIVLANTLSNDESEWLPPAFSLSAET